MTSPKNSSWTPSSQNQTSRSDARRPMPTPSMTSPHPTLAAASRNLHDMSLLTRRRPANDGDATMFVTPYNFISEIPSPSRHHVPAVAGHDRLEMLHTNLTQILEAISAEKERRKRKEEVEAIRAESGLQRGQERAQGQTRKRRAQRKTTKKDKGKGRAEAPGSTSHVLQSPPAYLTPSGSGVQSPSSLSMPNDHEMGSQPHHTHTPMHSCHNAQTSSFSYEQGTPQEASNIHLWNVPGAAVLHTQTGQELHHVPGPMRPRSNGRRPVGPYPTANAESGKRRYLGTEENITIIKNRSAFLQKLMHHVKSAKDSHQEVMCRIEGCGVIICGTRKDFETHLDANHPAAEICTWIDEESGPCRQEHSAPALQKRHIIDIHCRVWNSDCPECGQMFSRNDTTTISRHNCPERTCWGCREVLASKPACEAHQKKCKAVGFSRPSNVGEREQDKDLAVGPPTGTEDVVDETLVDAEKTISPSTNEFAYAPVACATPFQTRSSATSTPAPTTDPAPTYFGAHNFAGHLTAQPTEASPDRPYSSEESSSLAQAMTPSHVPNGGALAPAQQAGFDPGQDVLGSSTSMVPAFMSPYLLNDTTTAMHAQPLYDQDYFAAIDDGMDKHSLEGILGIPTYPEWNESDSML